MAVAVMLATKLGAAEINILLKLKKEDFFRAKLISCYNWQKVQSM